MVVPYRVAGDSFVAEKSRVFSEQRISIIGTTMNHTIAPDGNRFVSVMNRESAASRPASQVTILFHSFDEVRRRLGQ